MYHRMLACYLDEEFEVAQRVDEWENESDEYEREQRVSDYSEALRVVHLQRKQTSAAG